MNELYELTRCGSDPARVASFPEAKRATGLKVTLRFFDAIQEISVAEARAGLVGEMTS